MLQDTARELEERLFELEKKLASKNQETRDLANIASVITSLLDIQSILASAMEIGIRQVSGEVGAVVRIINDKQEASVSSGIDGTVLGSLIYKDGLDIVSYCFQQQKTICENNCSRLFPDQVAIRNFVCSPIMSRNQVAGVMIICNKETDVGFTDQDLMIMDMIGKLASVAIENSTLMKEALEKQRMENELILSRQVQAIFLPEAINFEGLRIAASHIPSRQAGGDYYDLIPISDKRLFFLIGDVSDKGLPALLVMTSVYSIVRSYVKSHKSLDLTTLMTQLNEILCSEIIKSHSIFITLFLAVIDLEKGHMEYCNGGHPPPFYYRASLPEIIPLKCGGPIIGQFAGTKYRSTKIEVGPGDRIFCYTDGLIEAANAAGELYGLTRLERFFREGIESNTGKFSQNVKNEIDRFSHDGRAESIDDFTTLVVDVAGPEEDSHRYDYVLASRLNSLEKMHKDIDAIAQRHAIPDDIIHSFRVAVSEAVTNAIVHAHGGDSSKKIRFAVNLNSERIMAVVIDEGSNPEILSLDVADPAGYPDAEGGRGLGLIKRLSDEAFFERAPEGGMQVKIIKYLPRISPNGG